MTEQRKQEADSPGLQHIRAMREGLNVSASDKLQVTVGSKRLKSR